MSESVGQIFINWILSNLDKKAGKTQSGLADRLGIAHPQITQLLKGKRDLKVREVPVIAEYLNAAPPEWPTGGASQIRDRASILEMLKRIDGLTDYDVQLHFELIMRDIRFNAAAREQSQSDDQPQQPNSHHALKPSQRR